MGELLAVLWLIAAILLVIAVRVWQGSNHARECADELNGLSRKDEVNGLSRKLEAVLDKLGDDVSELHALAKAHEARREAAVQRSIEEARRAELERRTAGKRQRIAEDQRRVAERAYVRSLGRKDVGRKVIPLP